MSFVYLPHTADLRAEVTGGTIAELYQSAVDVVRDVVFDDSVADDGTVYTVDLGSRSEAERFLLFVRELVFLVDAEGFVPGRVTMDEDQARLAGEIFDAARHHVERQIKAVTRHGYRFEREHDRLRAELVFDL